MAIEYALPDADTAAGGWTTNAGGSTSLFATIDEATASDADFVKSPMRPSVASAELIVRLYQGASLIATWTHTGITSETYVDAEQTLTAPQLAAITDFANLFIELDDSVGSVYRASFGNPTTALTTPVKIHYRYRGSHDLDPAPAAPVLELLTDGTDNTPEFEITGDLAENDVVRFQYSTASDFTGASEATNAIDAAEDAANLLDFATGTLADGTWYFRCRIERLGHVDSAWSNTETIAISVGGGGTTPTIWNDADDNVVTVTGSGLIVSAGHDNWCSIRSVDATTANQKVYFENVVTALPWNSRFGFMTAATTLSGPAPGAATVSTAVWLAHTSGTLICVDSADHGGGHFTAWVAGDNVDVAMVITGSTAKIWVRSTSSSFAWNDLEGGTQNPATGEGGLIVPFAGPYKACWQGGGLGDTATTRFASASWVRTDLVSAGFTQLGA